MRILQRVQLSEPSIHLVDTYCSSALLFLSDTTYRVQALPYGKWVHPNDPDRDFVVDEEVVDSVVQNFNDHILDSVPVPWRHTDDPRENAGNVVGVLKVEDGLDVIIDVPEAVDKIDKQLVGGVSLSLDFAYMDKKTGANKGPTMKHCALVSGPYIKGMRKFVKLDAEELRALGIDDTPLKAAAEDTVREPVFLADNTRKRTSEVQTIVFSKKKFTVAECRTWLKRNGYKTSLDETGESFRTRQTNPDSYREFRSESVASGITLVYGIKKKAVNAGEVVMTKDELIAALKADHGIDVALLQETDAAHKSVLEQLGKVGKLFKIEVAADNVGELHDKAKAAQDACIELAELRAAVSEKVQLSDGQKLKDVLVKRVDEQIVLSDRISTLEAERDVEVLLSEKKILPAERDEFVELRKTNKSLFVKMAAKRKAGSVVDLGEKGTDNSTNPDESGKTGKANTGTTELSETQASEAVDRYTKMAAESKGPGMEGIVRKCKGRIPAAAV